ncbi:MAG: pseudouridine synthase [Ruminococcus sp.]|uniref:pseudouridine synthase n=1 Tax=Ruminococcus sp. TaxID=41978 RepID=UPI0025EAAFC3|nr:pseudouridine synthase [Ruminococcus sp.]MCR5600108.1 pseudouridine synthase [Ruminococcus sp.]
MLYYMFNKPQGCVTARRDAVHRTVMDYFPAELTDRLHPVGRLDKDTCGLLIITDDGDLDMKIMQPEKHISKTYFFYAVGSISDEKIQLLENGIPMANFTTKNAVFCFGKEYRIRSLEEFIPDEKHEKYMKNPEGPAFSATLTICEGKKHEIKRMLEAVGCKIFYLRRDRIGALSLDPSLKEGEYRQLTPNELKLLKT